MEGFPIFLSTFIDSLIPRIIIHHWIMSKEAQSNKIMPYKTNNQF